MPAAPIDARPSAARTQSRPALRFWLAALALVLATELAFRAWPRPWPYYRGWNWLHVSSGPYAPDTAPGPFFPNLRYAGDCYGDLAFVSGVRGLRTVRPQVFTTDGYGYRNEPGRELGPWYVLALGDSMMAGAGLSDADLFTTRLEALLERPVYNAGGPVIGDVLGESRLHTSPPRFVLIESIERYVLPNEATLGLGQLPPAPLTWPAPPPPVTEVPERIVRERWSPAFSAATHYGSRLTGELRWALFRTVADGECIVGNDGHTLFSAEEMTHGIARSEQLHLDRVAEAVAGLRDWFASFGVELVYVLVPDKATLYRERVPARYLRSLQPPGQHVRELQGHLDALGVAYVDLHAAFLAARAASDEELYWSDDTHWSPHGTAVAARATAARLAQLAGGD